MTVIPGLQSKLVECCLDILRDPVKLIGNTRIHKPQTGLTAHCIGTMAQCINSPAAFVGGRHNQRVNAYHVRKSPVQSQLLSVIHSS